MTELTKLFSLLSSKEKKILLLVIGFLFISSIMQFLGISTIIVVIGLLADQDQILNNDHIIGIYNYLKFDDKKLFVNFLFIISGIAIFLSTILSLINNYVISKTSTTLALRIEQEIFFYYLNCDYSFFSKKSITTLINNIKDHSPRIGAFFIPSFLTICTNLSMLLIILVSLILVDTKVTIFSVLVIFLTYSFFFKGFRKILKKESVLLTDNVVNKTSFMYEALSNIKTIKFFRNYNFFKKNFLIKSKNILSSQIKLTMIETSPRVLMEFTLYFGTIAIIWYYFNSFEKYNFTKIIFFAVASSKALPTINAIFASVVRYKTALPSLKVFNKEFSEIYKKLLNNNKKEKIIFEKNIKLENVFFNFEESEFKLKNINLEISKGDFIGICGPTGSGKTTLIDIICSVYQPLEGYLKIDEKKIDEKNADDLKDKISYVSQNFFLGDMTLSELISFGSNHINFMEEVKEASKIAEIHDFIENLPNKYDTKFGDSGLKLSGGQQQRIALARALFKKPQILVLDETTGSLDLITEKKIIENLKKITKKITIILIAHRVASLKNCNKIIILKDGKISSYGTYEELSSNSSLFKKLI